MGRHDRSSHRGHGWQGCVAVVAIVQIAFGRSMVSAQQPPPATPRAPIPVQSNFTGAVSNLDASNVHAVRFHYEPGARSYWHVHDGSQVLLVEEGRGLVQVQGQPIRELVPGQPVFLPANVPHWHGAAPDQGFTQIAVNVGTVKWMKPVSDEEYRAPVKR
jgi:quercetin dioxygenase-like cupin family protein